jgi:hypothetical protein
MATETMFPNLFHSSNWQVNFSNMPALESIRDMRLYDNLVKSVTFPDYNMSEIYSDFMGFRVRHPEAPKINVDLSQIQISFKLSEDMRNYIYLFEWMKAMKAGDVTDFSSEEDLFRKNTIKSISLNILDNQKRTVAVWRFTEAFLLSLSSLALDNGISEEVTFTCNFSYEQILYEKKNVLT